MAVVPSAHGLERRYSELRVSGRTVTGTVVRYGDTAELGGFSETFEEGAYGDVGALDVTVNVQHERSRLLGRTGRGGVLLRQEGAAVVMAATLPATREADDALTLIRNGTLRGLSSEFHAERERFEGNLRRIISATLSGIGIVDRSAYPGSEGLQVRQRRTLSGRIPTGRRLGCKCQGPNCNAVQFEDGSLDVSDSAIAVNGNYGQPIASARRGGVRVRSTDGGLEVEVDLPDGEIGDQIRELAEALPVYIRPYLDAELSRFAQTGDLRTFSHARVRAFILGATDADEGMIAATFGRLVDPTPAPPTRRALWPSL